MQKYIPLFLKGFVMGAADIVPGVSGGTMALILGIYEKLLSSLTAIKPKKLLTTINWRLFLPVGLGILSAIFLFSGILHTALTQYTGPTYAFFFGLILVSGLFVLRQLKSWSSTVFLALTLGVIFAYMFVGLNPLAGNHTLPAIFTSGAVAIMAMMLPGVSGSFLLLVLGQYEFILNAVHERNIIILAIFSLGCLVGLLGFSHILNYLLKHYHSPTLAFLIGMIFGSLRLPITTMERAQTPLSTALAFITIGGLLVLLIERAALRRQPSSSSTSTSH